MKWKLFFIALINICCLVFPYNIIGCAETPDPYDYYTSFFRNDLSDRKGFKPFYYTNFEFLYEPVEPEDASRATAAEWTGYCNNKTTRQQAYDFVCRFDMSSLSSLYTQVKNNQTTSLPDSVLRNNMTRYFIQSKDLEALQYLLYAKEVEPFLTADGDAWEAPKRDSLGMNRLITKGIQLHATAKNNFIKLRYGFQVTRLALYNQRNKDCIRFYNELVQPNHTQSVLHSLAAGLKAGALFRTGQKKQAALLYSREFARTPLKRVANYISFSWCVNRFSADERNGCLSVCTNNEDKVNMMGLFALGSTMPEAKTIEQIYQLAPAAPILEILATREINKIEENYLSPSLAKQKGGKKLFYDESNADRTDQWAQEANKLIALFHTIAQNNATANKALFETAAAYLAYLSQDYSSARMYLSIAEQANPSQKIKDQVTLTSLLVTINEKPTIDSTFEATLLPSMEWLRKKAMTEKRATESYYYSFSEGPWHQFYRNLFSELLSKRYHAQHEVYKEALCIGNGESLNEWGAATKDFVRNDMATKDILALYTLQNKPNKTAWENFLCSHFVMSKDEVSDMIAMTHTRDYQFNTAIKWLSKMKDPELLQLQRNPFGDQLKDNVFDSFPFDKGRFYKIDFLKEMAALTDKENQKKATAPDLYKLAVGYYNMTYYGRAWEMVKYYRSGSDGYAIPTNATPFLKEYYGCFTAEKYFRKAMQASMDANFKARCLFMMAKCSQKRIPRPSWDYRDEAAWQKTSKAYELAFMHNQYFPQLQKDYGNTEFFKEAVNTCSYLKDFVKKQ